MAYVDIYKASFESRSEGVVDIFIAEDGGTGPATVMELHGRSHCITAWEMDGIPEVANFMPSNTSISLFDREISTPAAPNDLAFGDKLIDADNPTKLLVRIEKSGVPKWYGFVITTTISQPEDYLSNISFTAHDGIAELKNKDFVTDASEFYAGRETPAQIIIECLEKLGFGIDVHFGFNWYPGGLSKGFVATDLILDNIYTNQDKYRAREFIETSDRTEAFEEDGYVRFEVNPVTGILETYSHTPISCYKVVEDLCTRYNLCIRQTDGAWYVLQNEELDKSSIRTWRYNSAGVFQATSTYNPRLSISGVEPEQRGEATRSSTPSYSAIDIQYQHGDAQVLRNPTFSGILTSLLGGIWNFDTWFRSSSNVDFVQLETVPGTRWSLDLANSGIKTWPGDVPSDWGVKIPSQQQYTDTLQPTLTPTEYITQDVTDIFIQEGDTGLENRLLFTGEFQPRLISGTSQTIVAGAAVYIPVRMKVKGELGTDYLLTQNSEPYDGELSWTNAATITGGDVLTNAGSWIYYPATVPDDTEDWTAFGLITPDLPDDCTVEVWVGGLIEHIPSNFSGVASFDEVYVDNIFVRPRFGDGVSNGLQTRIVNYIDRDKKDILTLKTQTGDGPSTAHRGSITYDSAGKDPTSDWLIGPYTVEPDSDDNIGALQGRQLLEAVRRPRRLHSAMYPEIGGTEIHPYNCIYRGGRAYAFQSLSKNWAKSSYDVTSYHVQKNSFTDDIDTDFIGGSAGTFGSSGNSTGIYKALGALGLGSGSREITVTDVLIAAGATTTIPVALMPEALVDSGDNLVIVTPRLEFYDVVCNADQLPGANDLTIVSYNFPKAIPVNSSIYLLESEVVTRVLMGERGFRVVSTGGGDLISQHSGTADDNIDIAASPLDIPNGNRLILKRQTGEPDVLVTLLGAVRRGQTSIEVNPPVAIEPDDIFVLEGHVSQGELLVTKNLVSLGVQASTDTVVKGDVGVLAADINATATSLTVNYEGGTLPFILRAGDSVVVNGRNVAAELDDIDTLVTYFLVLDPNPTNIASHSNGEKIVSTVDIFADTTNSPFTADMVGKYINKTSGTQPGFHKIIEFIDADSVRVSPGTWTGLDSTTETYTINDVEYPVGYSGALQFKSTLMNVDEGATIQASNATSTTQRSYINIGLDGIEIESRAFMSSNWDGTIDADGYISGLGTKGWAASGQGDFQATGIFYAGGRTDAEDHAIVEMAANGIDIYFKNLSDQVGQSIESIRWLSGVTEYGRIWTDWDDSSVHIVAGATTSLIVPSGTAGLDVLVGMTWNSNLIIDEANRYHQVASAPSVNDDTLSGYEIGHRWLDTAGDREYVCFDNTAGAAIWLAGGGTAPIYDTMVELSDAITFDGTTDESTDMQTLLDDADTNFRPIVFGADSGDSSNEMRLVTGMNFHIADQANGSNGIHWIGNQISGRIDFLPTTVGEIALDIGDGDNQHYDDLYIANFNGGAEGAYGVGLAIGKLGKNHEGTPGTEATWASSSRSTYFRPRLLSMDIGLLMQRGWINDIFAPKINWNATYGVASYYDGVNTGTGEINAINFWGGAYEANGVGIYYNGVGSQSNISHWGITVEGSVNKEIEIHGSGTHYAFYEPYLENSSGGSFTHMVDIGTGVSDSLGSVRFQGLTVSGTEPVMFDNTRRIWLDGYTKYTAWDRIFVGPGVEQSWITKPAEAGTASDYEAKSMFIDNPRNHGPYHVFRTDFGELDTNDFPIDTVTPATTYRYPLDASGMYQIYAAGSVTHIELVDHDTNLNQSGKCLKMQGVNQGTDSHFRFRVTNVVPSKIFAKTYYEEYAGDNRYIVNERLGSKFHVRILAKWGESGEKPTTPYLGSSYSWSTIGDVPTTGGIAGVNLDATDADYMDWVEGKAVWFGYDVDLTTQFADGTFDSVDYVECLFQPTQSGAWSATEVIYVYAIEVYPTWMGPWELSGFKDGQVSPHHAQIWQANIEELDVERIFQNESVPNSLSNASHQLLRREYQSQSWVVGTMPPGSPNNNSFGYRYYNADPNTNNTIIESTLPYGEQLGAVWKGTCAVGNNMGMFTPKIKFDPGKSYGVGVWVRADVAETEGTTYFGFRSDDFEMVDHGDAVTTYTNPYFRTGGLDSLGDWYFMYAVVHAAGTTDGASAPYADDVIELSGIYNVWGEKVANADRDLQWPTGQGSEVEAYGTFFAILAGTGERSWRDPQFHELNGYQQHPSQIAKKGQYQNEFNTLYALTDFAIGNNTTADEFLNFRIGTSAVVGNWKGIRLAGNNYPVNSWATAPRSGWRATGTDNNSWGQFDIEVHPSSTAGDPSVTAAEFTDTMATFLGGVTAGGDLIQDGRLQLKHGALSNSISGGVLTITHAIEFVEAEVLNTADDLDTISGGLGEGTVVFLRWYNIFNSGTVTIKHGTGNIFTDSGNDIVLDSINKIVRVVYTDDGTNIRWLASDIQTAGEANTVSDTGGGLALHGAKVGVDFPFYTLNATYFAQAGGLISIAAGGVNNSRMANMKAYSFKGNITGSSATPTDWDITDLAELVSPVMTDKLIIWDQDASQMKWVDYDNITGDPDQDLWYTIAGDTGSTVPNLATDTLTFTGGTLITTQAASDVVTIDISDMAAYTLIGRNAGTTGAPTAFNVTALIDIDAAHAPATTDWLMIWDTDLAALRKVSWNSLPGGAGGDVTAAAVITDNRLVRGDGGAKGIQESLLIVDDTGFLSGVTGIDLIHTAAEPDDHALEIVANAAGFGDVKAVDIDYITGAIAGGADEAAIIVNIDESASTGGDVFGLEVVTTTLGSALVKGLVAGVGVGPVVQLSGTFTDADSILNKAVDVTSALADGGAGNITMFVADNDTITIGNAAKFEEIEVLIDTAASGSGVAPTFEYSTGVGTWASFTPTDGTNGFRNTGVMLWLDGDIPSWAVGTGSEYLIRVTRTRNSLTTSPIVDEIQIAGATEYGWDANANVTVASVTVDDEAYAVGWNASLETPTKNAVYDKIEALPAGNELVYFIGCTANGTSGGTQTVPFADVEYVRSGFAPSLSSGELQLNVSGDTFLVEAEISMEQVTNTNTPSVARVWIEYNPDAGGYAEVDNSKAFALCPEGNTTDEGQNTVSTSCMVTTGAVGDAIRVRYELYQSGVDNLRSMADGCRLKITRIN
jgi:hypothetical protein